MDLDYIEYNDYQIYQILDNSYELYNYYNKYKQEAILCQNFNLTTIQNKKELIKYCYSIFNFIDLINQNQNIINKNQIKFNCKWFLYNILQLCLHLY